MSTKELRKYLHDLTNHITAISAYFGTLAFLHARKKEPLAKETAAVLLAVNSAIRTLEKIRAALILMEDNGE